MLAALVKSAGYFVLGMIVASVLNEIVSRMTPYMEYPDGSTPQYVEWFVAVDTNFVLFVFISLLFALLARATVEASLGGVA